MTMPLHAWQLTPAEARATQRALAARVCRQDRLGVVQWIAGVDVGFEQAGTVTRAAVVLMSWPGLQVMERVLARVPTAFPYVPGLLSFRELPAVLQAFDRLTLQPDLVLCDGQGIAHPRRFGIACHLGVWLDVPAIGVAKKRLVGHHDELVDEKGAVTALWDKDEQIGSVVRTRQGVKPVFVSIGHCISHATALEWVMKCLTLYRLPEPIRQAHRLASLEK